MSATVTIRRLDAGSLGELAPQLSDLFADAVAPHRAEIVKLVVHRRARGRGLAEALMQAAEREARAMGRPHLTLFTRRGCEAERPYEKLGWSLAGVIPHDSAMPGGTPCDGALYFKQLAP
ncbi:MAG: GNAT family N-acetyltransferase [Burkholderiales bacterium]|nr:GNAT family N-acetyltransferase [Burkholderiales bacterium]